MTKSSTPLLERREYYLYITTSLFILLFSILYIYQLKPLIFILDDAYIVIHNVQVLISGYDINYPGVSALSGTTSLVHLALVRFFAFFVSPLLALYIVTWLAILIYALGLLRLAFIYAASNLKAALFLISGLLIGLTPFNLFNGLETGIAMGLLVWVIIFIITEQRILTNLLLGLLPFVRPELILLTFILWSSRGYYYWREQKNLKYICIELIKDIFIISISALPFAMWYFIALGIPYPETLDAKKYFFAEQYLSIPEKTSIAVTGLYIFVVNLGFFNFIAILSLMFLNSLSRFFLLFFIVFFLLYLMVFPAAFNYNYQRYLYIFLPMMLYGVIACNKHPKKFIRQSGSIILVILFISTMIYLPNLYKTYLKQYHYMSNLNITLKTWCEKNIPPDSKILIQDAGYISYATDFHLIDFVGLKTPENIRYHQELTFPSKGQKRGEAIAQIIHHTHPQYLIITKDWDRLYHITEGLKQQGVTLQAMPVINEYICYRLKSAG